MPTILAIASGGAAGALLRHYLNSAITHILPGSSFPWGIFVINVIGSFLLGILISLFAHFWEPPQAIKAFLTVGMLGAFTTFSTFSLDTVLLIERGAWSQYLEVGIGPDAEIFTKTTPMAAVGTGMDAGLHPKSHWNNPEPEVVLACDSRGRIRGATFAAVQENYQQELESLQAVKSVAEEDVTRLGEDVAMLDADTAGAVVLGVSPDAAESHARFAEKYRLPFSLLSDPDRSVMNAYGAWGEKTLYGRKTTGVIRSTVWIGPDGGELSPGDWADAAALWLGLLLNGRAVGDAGSQKHDEAAHEAHRGPEPQPIASDRAAPDRRRRRTARGPHPASPPATQVREYRFGCPSRYGLRNGVSSRSSSSSTVSDPSRRTSGRGSSPPKRIASIIEE